MDNGVLSALAALFGSTIGGCTSLAASWLSKNAEARVQEFVQVKQRRELLYKDFIEEASRLYGDALGSNNAEVPKLVGLYSMVSRMRVLSSPTVVYTAEKVVRMIIDTYFQPNRTLRDLRETIQNGQIDILSEFSVACRDDLFHRGRG